MLSKHRWGFISVWTYLLFAAPASAAVTYAFTSDQGDFTFISPSFFDNGNIPGHGGVVVSHSGDFDAVLFRSSDIFLLNRACEFDGNCFDATFLEDGIFLRTGTFFASDGNAKIVISGNPTAIPVPELSSWAMLAVGLAGLAFAKNSRVSSSNACRSAKLTPGRAWAKVHL
jgi:amino acid transporter